MSITKLKIAAGIGSLMLSIAVGPAYQTLAEDPIGATKKTPGIPSDQFGRIQALIKPKPGGFADIPWMTDLWEARKKAAAEGKPILIWVGDGHPLGFT